jgi:hypothetical protein
LTGIGRSIFAATSMRDAADDVLSAVGIVVRRLERGPGALVALRRA